MVVGVVEPAGPQRIEIEVTPLADGDDRDVPRS